MANKILIKKSTVTGKIPLASDLDIGELAINTADARLYTKHSDNSIRLLRAEPILPDVGTIGTYTKVTTDAQGRITSGTTLSETDVPLLSISKTDGLQSALDLKATLASPTFTGTPTAPTPVSTDNSTKIATTEFVQNVVVSAGGYSGWNISDGITSEFVSSTSTITFVGSGTSSVSYDGPTRRLTISSEVPDIEDIDGLQDALNLKANLASPTFTGTVSGITKTMVGLGSVDNTADSAKNVLSATKLTTARTIGGVSFDGTANINLPGVNAAGTQNTTGSSGSCTGNAATATKLATARTIGLSGDVTGSASFDGSANTSITVTVVDDLHNHIISNVDGLQGALDGKVDENAAITAGTGTKITYDAKGLVTSSTSLSATDIPSLDASKITSGTIDSARLPSNVDGLQEALDMAVVYAIALG